MYSKCESPNQPAEKANPEDRAATAQYDKGCRPGEIMCVGGIGLSERSTAILAHCPSELTMHNIVHFTAKPNQVSCGGMADLATE